MLQESHGDLVPLFDHPGEQGRSLQAKFRLEPDREGDFLRPEVGSAVEQMGSRHPEGGVIAAQLRDGDPEKGEKVCELAAIDGAQRKELEDSRRELAVFDVRQPGMGHMEFPVVPFLRNLPASLLHIPRGQAQAHAQFFQPFTCTRTLRAHIHGGRT